MTHPKCDVGSQYSSGDSGEATRHDGVQLGSGHLADQWTDQQRRLRLTKQKWTIGILCGRESQCVAQINQFWKGRNTNEHVLCHFPPK